jgi:hypothetical protein
VDINSRAVEQETDIDAELFLILRALLVEEASRKGPSRIGRNIAEVRMRYSKSYDERSYTQACWMLWYTLFDCIMKFCIHGSQKFHDCNSQSRECELLNSTIRKSTLGSNGTCDWSSRIQRGFLVPAERSNASLQHNTPFATRNKCSACLHLHTTD